MSRVVQGVDTVTCAWCESTFERCFIVVLSPSSSRHVFPVHSWLRHLHLLLCPVANFSSSSTGLYCD